MFIELKEKEVPLFDLLSNIPPSIEPAERFLLENHLSAAEITRVGIKYAEKCFCDAGDYAWKKKIAHSADVISGLHSTYIYEVIELLLKYGLEPNGIYDEYNIMEALKWVDNEFLAADMLALLLEHGGDLRLVIEGEEFFQSLDFDVFFDAVEQYDRRRYASLVHFWMVAIGYGARHPNNEAFITVFREYDSDQQFDLSKLKNHRKYYFGITHTEKDFALNIYDKDTLWEVARIV